MDRGGGARMGIGVTPGVMGSVWVAQLNHGRMGRDWGRQPSRSGSHKRENATSTKAGLAEIPSVIPSVFMSAIEFVLEFSKFYWTLPHKPSTASASSTSWLGIPTTISKPTHICPKKLVRFPKSPVSIGECHEESQREATRKSSTDKERA